MFMNKTGRGGGVSRFSVEGFFCLTVPKYFVGEHFSVSLILGTENFYGSVGYVTFFCRKFFLSHSAEKFIS